MSKAAEILAALVTIIVFQLKNYWSNSASDCFAPVPHKATEKNEASLLLGF